MQFSEAQIKAWMDDHAASRRIEVKAELIRRIKLLRKGRKAPAVVLAACKKDPLTFINDWVWTYDPRNPADNLPARVPLHLRPRQIEFIQYVEDRIALKQNGVIEKSRDEGMTWVICALFIHHWLFQDGFKAGIGSRKIDLVDRKDDPDSIFEKLRFILRNLPKWMLPEGYSEARHANYKRLANPANGASIVGEGGDDIGRGGRNAVYFVDEHAKIERAELVEASLSQNAPTILYGSTPRGVGNLFYIKRFAPGAHVFTFDWKQNPDKNYFVEIDGQRLYPWYEAQKLKYDAVTIAQEIDIDYTASVSGIVIAGAWVQAALKLKLPRGSVRRGGLDVSDEGADKTVYAGRAGPVITRVDRLEGVAVSSDVKERALLDEADAVFYDRLGVGAAITATLAREERLPFEVQGIANSEEPTQNKYPDLPMVPAAERFADYAAELWWRLRIRFRNTWERVELGKDHPDDECISLFEINGKPECNVLIAQLSQPTFAKIGVSDKIRVNKKGEGTKSPDHAESVMYSFAAPRYAKPRRGNTSGYQENWG